MSSLWMKKAAPLAALVVALVVEAGSARAGGTSLADLPAFTADAATLRAAAGAANGRGADVVMLLEDVTYRIDADDTIEVIYRRILSIVTPAGAKDWQAVSVSWSPWRESQPTIRGRVLTTQGQFVDTDATSFTVQPAGSPHDDSGKRIVDATMPPLAPGCVVEQETRWTTRALFGPRTGAVNSYLFGNDVPVEMERVTIDAPRAARLRVVEHATAGLTHRVTRAHGRVVHVYTRGPSGPEPKTEPSAPVDASTRPYLAFTTVRSWAALAAARARAIDQQIAAGDVATAGIPLPHGTTRHETIANVLAAVRARVAVSALSVNESEPAPWTPAQTWKNRRGTGFDRATLVVAMLRASKIPARVALTTEDPARETPLRTPLPFFSHALVVVPGARPVWIDPESDVARAGELPTYVQGRRALIVDRKTRKLTTTPVTTSADNRVSERCEVFLPDFGRARVVETTVLTGRDERSFRNYYRGIAAADLNKQLADYAKSRYEAHLDQYSFTPPTDLSTPFTLKLELSAADEFAVNDDTSTMAARAGAAFNELPAAITEDEQEKAVAARKNDFELGIPLSHELTYEFHVPPGHLIGDLPESDVVQLGVLTLTREVSRTATSVTVRFLLQRSKARITADELRATRTAVRGFLDSDAWSFDVRLLVSRDLDSDHAGRAVRELRALIRSLSRSRGPPPPAGPGADRRRAARTGRKGGAHRRRPAPRSQHPAGAWLGAQLRSLRALARAWFRSPGIDRRLPRGAAHRPEVLTGPRQPRRRPRIRLSRLAPPGRSVQVDRSVPALLRQWRGQRGLRQQPAPRSRCFSALARSSRTGGEAPCSAYSQQLPGRGDRPRGERQRGRGRGQEAGW